MKPLYVITRSLYLFLLTFVIILAGSSNSGAQSIQTGFDLYSTYVWRGVAYSGPAVQPHLNIKTEQFEIGSWGSQGYDGMQEVDLYTQYHFDFGLSLGLTDYYYPGTRYLNFESHAFEINGTYHITSFMLFANYILNSASIAGSAGGDMYFEALYSRKNAEIFIGGGNGWHSSHGQFSVVNIGLRAIENINISESVNIPFSGSLIFNPDTEQFYILGGLSF